MHCFSLHLLFVVSSNKTKVHREKQKSATSGTAEIGSLKIGCLRTYITNMDNCNLWCKKTIPRIERKTAEENRKQGGGSAEQTGRSEKCSAESLISTKSKINMSLFWISMITVLDGLHTSRGRGSAKDQSVKNYSVTFKVNVILLIGLFRCVKNLWCHSKWYSIHTHTNRYINY